MYSFTIRLNELIDSLGAANSELAEFTGCDRSNISRLRSGARVPKRDGAAALRLADGLYGCAESAGRVGELCGKIDAEDVSSPQVIKDHILKWLFEGMEYRGSGAFAVSDSAPFRSFGEKLSAVMNLTELSNIRFSRLINMDPSNISRFRSGMRTPKSNPRTVDAICGVLLDRAGDQNRLDALSKLTGIPIETLADETAGIRYFRGWLCDFDAEDSGIVIEKLIDRIDSFTVETTAPLPDYSEIVPKNLLNSRETVYYGTDGLREAAIRLLARASEKGASELWLYSDQSMDWMTGDRRFFLKWSSLMARCVSKGVKITIIHNLDRELGEMMDAITGWMPLYMSGMIEPHYCGRQRESRFSHSLFLIPGEECVEGCNTVGGEQSGCWRYHTDRRTLSVYRAQFETLMLHAKPLMKISRLTEAEERLPSDMKNVTVLNQTLSLATMPQSVLTSVLDRCGADGEARRSITEEWQRRSGRMFDTLEYGRFRECVKLPEVEAVQNGKVRIDIPNIDAFYTPEEYAAHAAAIIGLTERCPGYTLTPLPEAPFVNTRLLITENTVNVTRVSTPRISFFITQPSMTDAFQAYAERLKRRCAADREQTVELLRQYL